MLFFIAVLSFLTILPHNNNEPQITCQASNLPNKSCHVMSFINMPKIVCTLFLLNVLSLSNAPTVTQRLDILQPAQAIFREKNETN